jgi:subtilisin family serine protease
MEAALWELAEGDADEEVEVIIRLHNPRLTPPGVRIVTQFGPIVTCRLQRRRIVAVRRDERVASMKAPMVVIPGAPAAEDARFEATDDSDHRRPRTQRETGRGVVLGVIDWGCDFTHPNFRHGDGRTRLAALWDQTAPYRPDRPNAYGYGVVHTAADIDRALRSERPDEALGYDWRRSDPGDGGAHGTHVMDIAAGSGRVGPAGVAPEAELVFVHLASRALPEQAALGDSVSLLEAVDFIFRAAGERPACINTSMGRQMGAHDGSSLVEQAFDAALTGVPGRFIGQSTGNYYDRGAHASGQLRPGQVLAIPFLVGEADVTPNELEVWYPGRDVLGVQLRAPTGELTRRTGPDDETTLRLDGHDACRVYHRAREPNNLDNAIHVYLYAGAPAGRWELVLTGDDVVDGRFDAWIERDAACADCQARFDARMAVPLSTTGSIANGFRPVAVGAYDAHDPELRLGRFSSAGPTRDGRIKPDLVAPGVEVLAARSAPRVPDGDEPRYLVRKSGTSMAAPHVTGTVALMFQAAGRPLHIQEVRNLLLTSTRPAELSDDSVHRVGSGYLDTDAAIAATRAYAAGGGPGVRLPAARETKPAALAFPLAGATEAEPAFIPAEPTEPAEASGGTMEPAQARAEGAEGTPAEAGAMGTGWIETDAGASRAAEEAGAEWSEDEPAATLGYCVPNGRITDPFYRDAAEKRSLTGRRTGRARHLGIDVSTSSASGGGADDARRGLPVYAALRPEIDLTELQAVRAVDAAGEARAGIGIAGTGTATLDHAVVHAQPWSSQAAGEYGGVLGLACRYTYTRADGSGGTLTLYVEWLHLVTPRFLPRTGAGDAVTAQAWAATGKPSGFGPRMRDGERLSAADLTGGAPLLVGYLGATQFPHVHIQAASRDGSHGYLKKPRFDPAVMLRTTLTLAAAPTGELADDLEEAYGPFAESWGAAEAGEEAQPAWRAEDFEAEDEGGSAFNGAFGNEWRPPYEGSARGFDEAGPELLELAEAALDPYGDQSPQDHFGRVFARAETAASRGRWRAAETPPWEQAGGLDAVRTAIRLAANAELNLWRTRGVVVYENAPGQLAHLVRYWLATEPAIRPDLLPVIQQRATAIAWPAYFFTARRGGGPPRAALVQARTELLSTLPAASVGAGLRSAVEGRLTVAFRSFHDDETPWSAAFVLACVRKAAIDQGLERMDGTTPRGTDTLLRITPNGRHLDYIREAYARGGGSGVAYRAELPTAQPVAVGDIVVMDRGATRARDMISLAALPETGATHGDIVVSVDPLAGYAVTVGGNLSDPEVSDPAISPARDSARCRRFPVAADGRLQVAADTLFQQEKNAAGTFQPLAEAGTLPAGWLARSSTLRVFGLLRLTA